MEPQTTPVSPPKKVRRTESIEGGPDGQNEHLEKADGDGNDNEHYRHLEEKKMQPSTSTTLKSANNQSTTNNTCPDETADFFNDITDYSILCENGFSVSENLARIVVDLETNKTDTDNTATTAIKNEALNSTCPQDALDQILKDLQCEDVHETKSMYMLLEEYTNNLPSQEYTESFFRTNIQSYLISSGEMIHNGAACTELMDKVNKADSHSIIRLMAAVLKQKQVPTLMQGDDPTQSNDGAKDGTSEDAIYELYLNKITGSVFTEMRAEMHDSKDKTNIAAIGKVLIKIIFTEQEILDGFLKKQTNKDGKETQAYDPKRVFLMSQVINFMITENEDITVRKFKETTKKNKGLQGNLYKYFVQSVMVEYANYLRKKSKVAKNPASSV